jgi:hypothetical protein
VSYDFDPELAAIIPLLPTTSLETVNDVATARTSMLDLLGELNAGVDLHGIVVTDHVVPGPAGTPDVPVRTYQPSGDALSTEHGRHAICAGVLRSAAGGGWHRPWVAHPRRRP